jgi:soluble lytic murein transglycosylase-like protein
VTGRVLVALTLGTALSAQAADHVTLRNGFDLVCDHRSTEGGKLRLYLDAASTSYIDVDPTEIATVEAMPDVAATPQAAPALPGAPAASAGTLTPAELHELLAAAGAEHALDVDLLASVVHAESGNRANAVSRAGAAGLMQLMPGTATQLGVTDRLAPDQNVHGGTAYLDGLLKRYHDNLALALAAYNAGPGAVDRYHGIPPYRETRAYVARIIHEFNQRYAARQALAAVAASKVGVRQPHE